MNFNDFQNWSGVLGLRCDELGFRAETKVGGIEYISPYKPTEEEARQVLYDICVNPKGYKHEPYVLPKSAVKTPIIEQVIEEPILTEKQLVEKHLVLEPMTDEEFIQLKEKLSTPIKEVVISEKEVV